MSDRNSGNIKVAVIENALLSSYTAREGLMKELVALHFEVYILTNAVENIEKVERMGVKVIHIGSANYNPLDISGYIFKLTKNLIRIKPDLCLTFTIRPAIWGNLIARFLKIPVITNITGTGPLFQSKSNAYKIIRKVYPIALRKTRIVFFQNADDRNEFIKRGYVSPSQTRMIPGSGVDHEKFKPIHLEKNPNTPFTFLYIGRLLRDKGVPEFVEAARLTKEKFPNVKFRIVGPVWKQNMKSNTISEIQLNEWIREGLIDYAGETTDVRSEIAACDCLVLPSHREGMSNVLLEAASMEKPTIASDVPGCREIIEDGITGLLCEVQNPLNLAVNMQDMIGFSCTEREEMGQRARKKVIREFDKRIVIDNYIREIENQLNLELPPVTVIQEELAPVENL
ncbi:MAG TPA: glycosyltransferase family 4 protein [Ginsengibacter sp.]|nr:glycosyltransferase family 4 protein [Ginsengibacter sp.]